MKDYSEKLAKLKNIYSAIAKKIDKDKLNQELKQLEAKSLKSDFWADVIKASAIMQQISDISTEIDDITQVEDSLKTFSELLSIETDTLQTINLDKELAQIEEKISKIEKKLFLSGKHDNGNCILTIHAGQGGVEAMDWASMVLRMYLRYCEKKGWAVTLIDETKGEEAGIKTSILEINGRYAYGLLKKESGTHRLVRLSPFNANNLRQTSFALVEVLPIIEDLKELEISDKDLEQDTFRSSGPGGQNVQKVSTAVRIKHIPTGITVSCQSERSQHQNRENALKIIKAKLFQKQQEQRKKNEQNLKSWEKTASWGTQIRSYVLHPYQLVKDLRTNYETTATSEILDGEIDGFIDSEVRLL